jgi:lipoprotein
LYVIKSLKIYKYLSLIVLFGTWLSCIKLKFETKGFVKNIELDGGAVMNSLIVTYMWVQMECPTGVCGVRSQMLT